MKINWLAIILVLILILVIVNRSRFFSSFKSTSLKRTGILLTCTVNTGSNIRALAQKNSSERKQMYIDSIIKWLKQTDFIIVVVDNSGYDFPELENYLKLYANRFEIISFRESDLPPDDYRILQNDPSKGTHEIYAINHGFYNSRLLSNCEYVIKVTGRYTVPDLQNHKLDGVDIIHQNNIETCEVIGCHRKHFDYLFNKKLEYINNEYDNDMIEVIYARRIKNLKGNKLQLPKLKIEPTRTGTGNVMKYFL